MRHQLKYLLNVCLAIAIAIIVLTKESEIIESIVSSKVISSKVSEGGVTSSSSYYSQDDDGTEGYLDKSSQSSSPFNQHNPYSKTWCTHPSIICYNSPFCKPCQRRYLFILATGRSGSTTLLKMMNSLPNIRLSGENYNAVFQMYNLFNNTVFQGKEGIEVDGAYNATKYSNFTNGNFYDVDAVKGGKFMHNGIKEGPFTHNAIPMGSLSCVIQNLANALNPPAFLLQERGEDNSETDTTEHINKNWKNDDKNILGMKEIRLQDKDLISWTPKEAYRFLQHNFPCARYIININSKFIYQSKTMKEHLKQKVGELNRKQIQEKIKLENQFLIDLNKLFGKERSRLIKLEEWREDVEVLNDIVDWLGFEGCKFNRLLYENRGGFEHDETELDLGAQCRYPHV